MIPLNKMIFYLLIGDVLYNRCNVYEKNPKKSQTAAPWLNEIYFILTKISLNINILAINYVNS